MSGLEMHYLVLINMLKQIIIMSHLIACCWNLIQHFEIQKGSTNTWLETQDFLQHDWWGRYFMCFYWSTATIMLIGTSGVTIIETLYCNFILFFTVGIFAYILENVAQTIKSITRDSMEYKSNLETLNKYMRNNNLDQESQVIVRQQLEFVYKSSQEININKQAQEVLKKLPDNLSTNIRNQINCSIIQKFTPLTRNFSSKTIEKTYQNPLIIQETSYVSQEIIFKQNDPLTDNQTYMYLVLGGQVELYYTKKNQSEGGIHQVHTIKIVKEGELFGVQTFFSGQIPKYSAKSSQFTNICRIKRSGFMNLLKYNKLEHEKFCYIQDQILQHGVTKYFTNYCFICQRSNHDTNDCNLLHYNPKRYQLCLIDRFQKTFMQTRQRYYRDSDYSEFKQTNALVFVETNELLNQHFNYKYTEIANKNHLFYKKYIEQLQQMEYISDSDSEYEDTSEANEGEDDEIGQFSIQDSVFQGRDSFQQIVQTQSPKANKNRQSMQNQVSPQQQEISVNKKRKDNRSATVNMKPQKRSFLNNQADFQFQDQQMILQQKGQQLQNNSKLINDIEDGQIKNLIGDILNYQQQQRSSFNEQFYNRQSILNSNLESFQEKQEFQNKNFQNYSNTDQQLINTISELMKKQMNKTNQIIKQQKKIKKELNNNDGSSYYKEKQQNQNLLPIKKQSMPLNNNNVHDQLLQIQQKTLLFKQPSLLKSKQPNNRQSLNHLESRLYSMNLQTEEDLFILNFDEQNEFELYFIKYNLSFILKKYLDKYQNNNRNTKGNAIDYIQKYMENKDKKKYFTQKINFDHDKENQKVQRYDRRQKTNFQNIVLNDGLKTKKKQSIFQKARQYYKK